MRSRLLDDSATRTFAVVFDKGDELVDEMQRFARDEGLDAARLTGVGALRRATLGYFDRDTMSYLEIPVEEQVELLSMLGDVAWDDGPAVHVHVVVGLRDGTTRGGHLLAGTVWPTVELIVTESPGHLRKSVDHQTGLALIDLARSGPGDGGG